MVARRLTARLGAVLASMVVLLSAEEGGSAQMPERNENLSEAEDMGPAPDYDALAARLGPLKTISLDGYRFRVPHSWDTGRDDAGVPWAAPPERDYGFERRVRLLPAGRDWRETIRSRAAEIMQMLTGDDMRKTFAELDVKRMVVLQVPAAKSDREGFSAWYWPQLLHIDGVIVETWLSLYVRDRLWHGADTEALEELLGQQFRRAPPGDPRLLGSLDEGFGFDRLRPMRAFGFIDLQVPARWYDEYAAPDGMWVACEDEPNTGTFWVQYDLFDGARERLLERYKNLFEKRGAISRAVDTPERLLFYEVQPGTEKDSAFVLHRWMLLEPRGSEVALLQFTLVLPRDQEEHREFVLLKQTVEREIAGARIGPFPRRRANSPASSSP
jgi:hypothetical protein